jgi:lysophospholipase L1-like esterase
MRKILIALFVTLAFLSETRACTGACRLLIMSGSGLPSSVKLTYVGDSLTAGLFVSPPFDYPDQVSFLLPHGPAYTTLNHGVSGITAATILANYPSQYVSDFDATKALNVEILFAGTNDVNSGTSASAIYVTLRSIIADARAAGFQRVTIATLIARNNSNDTTQEMPTIISLNGLIRSYWNSDLSADALVDFFANPAFSTQAGACNATYYQSDCVHLTALGYYTLATIAEPQIVSVMKHPGTQIQAPLTFSPIDIASSGVLSNGNRTITNLSGFGNRQVRGFPGVSSGKYCWEISADAFNNLLIVGLVNTANEYNGAFQPGTGDNNSIGYFDTGAIEINGTTLAAAATWTGGDIIQECQDFTANLAWFRRVRSGVAQSWNGNGSANPSTGVGGVSTGPLGTGKRYPIAMIEATGDQLTSNFSASQLTQPVPSGFASGFGP